MRSLPKSRFADPNSKEALRALFFEAGTMEAFRNTRCVTYHASRAHRPTTREVLDYAFGDPAQKIDHSLETIEFRFQPIHLGPELWAAVIAYPPVLKPTGNRIAVPIIEPFLIPDAKPPLIPLFPEEQ